MPRLFLACWLCLPFGGAGAAFAQSAPAPNTAQLPIAAAPTPPPGILSVPLPPNARLRFDFDAQDEDVLGVAKSLLRGFNGANLSSVLNGWKGSKTGATQAPAQTSAAELDAAATLQMLSDADLQTLLRDVHHLRAVFFETPANYSNRAAQLKTSQSVLNFYQAAYIDREGGRRILRGDFDDTQLIGMGFPGRGFALVLQAPGFGMVLRADGYPNLESIGPVAMAAFLRLAPSARRD